MALARPTGARKRLLVYYIPHGLPNEHVMPDGDGTSFDLAQGPGVGILNSLAPYQDKFLMFKGFKQAKANVHQGITDVLNDGDGASILHRVAGGLGVPVELLGALPQRPTGAGNDSSLINDGSGFLLPEANPVIAAERLLGGIDGAPPEPALDESKFRQRALSVSMSQVEALQGQLQSLTTEQSKLSAHLTGLQAVLAKGDGLPLFTSCIERPVLPTVDALREEAEPLKGTGSPFYRPDGPYEDFFLKDEKFAPILDAQLDIAANALVCGSAQVMGIQLMYANANVSFGFTGVNGRAGNAGHHEPVSHALFGTPLREDYAQCQKWLIDRLESRVLRVLNQPDPTDPGRTVLDNTLVYVCSEVADGQEHNSDRRIVSARQGLFEFTPTERDYTNLPLFMIGGAGGALKTGQIVRADNRSHADVLMTIGDAMGVPTGQIGAGTGVISEVLA